MNSTDTTTIGILLLLIVPLLFVEFPAYTRGRYTTQFWNLDLDGKLDHIGAQPEYWTRMGAAWLPLLTFVSAGMTGFAFQLAARDTGVVAFAALGGFLIGTFAWLIGVIIQTIAMRTAAQIRRETGTTPDWLAAAWTSAWWSELTFVVSANVAFIAWGIIMLDTGFPATWMGWTAIILGALAIAMVVFAREAFPQLGVVVPVVLGVALVLY